MCRYKSYAKEFKMAKVITGNDRFIKVVTDNGAWGWVLFAAYIGAVVYFFQIDPTFWGFLLALIKAAFWPASLGVA